MTDPLAAELAAQVRVTLLARLDKAAEFVAEGAKADLSIPYPPASQVGEAAHRRTGNLRDSVDSVVIPDEMTGVVGATAEYAGYLEDPGLFNRPSLRLALESRLGDVVRILEGG